MATYNEDVSEKIRSTFLRLLDEQPYKRITFKEIATESGMTRQNLYYYYKSKEHVLEDIIEEFLDDIYDEIMKFNLDKLGASNEDLMGKTLIITIAEAMRNNEEKAKCFFSRDVNIVFLNKMVAFLNRMLGSLIRAQNVTVNDPKFIHYLALQLSGASYLLLREWLLVDREFPVERLAELAHPMVAQIIHSLKSN